MTIERCVNPPRQVQKYGPSALPHSPSVHSGSNATIPPPRILRRPCEVARQVRPPSRVRGRVEVGRIPRHPRGGPPAPASAAAAPPRAGRYVTSRRSARERDAPKRSNAERDPLRQVVWIVCEDPESGIPPSGTAFGSNPPPRQRLRRLRAVPYGVYTVTRTVHLAAPSLRTPSIPVGVAVTTNREPCAGGRERAVPVPVGRAPRLRPYPDRRQCCRA